MKKRFKKTCAIFLTLGLLLQSGFAGGVSAADPAETPKRFVEAEDGILLPNAAGQYAEIASKRCV